MIVALIVLFFLDLALIAALGWEKHKHRVVQSAPLPSFAKEPRCVECDRKIVEGEKTIDVHMKAAIGDKSLPVTAYICEDCVSRA